MTLLILLSPTLARLLGFPLQLLDKLLHPLPASPEIVRRGIEMRFDNFHFSRWGVGLWPTLGLRFREGSAIGRRPTGTYFAATALRIASTATVVGVPGRKISRMPIFFRLGMSCSGMIPPAKTTISCAPSSSSSFMIWGKSTLCAPERMD